MQPLPDRAMLALRDALIESGGETPVRIEIPVNGKTVCVVPEDRFRVCIDEQLLAAIESIVGSRGTVRQRFPNQEG